MYHRHPTFADTFARSTGSWTQLDLFYYPLWCSYRCFQFLSGFCLYLLLRNPVLGYSAHFSCTPEFLKKLYLTKNCQGTTYRNDDDISLVISFFSELYYIFNGLVCFSHLWHSVASHLWYLCTRTFAIETPYLQVREWYGWNFIPFYLF